MLKIARMFGGLFFYAIGIVILLNANMGLAPWDALHVGLSINLGISFGRVSILLGMIILLINFFLKEGIGFGTISNMLLIGLLIDLITWIGVIPKSNSYISGVLMILVGMLSIAFGNFAYVSSGFGAGPRDGLMIGLSRISGMSIGVIVIIIDGVALLIGYLLGAKIGIGTVLIGVGLGPMIQAVYKLFDFEPDAVEQNLIIEGHTYTKEQIID